MIKLNGEKMFRRTMALMVTIALLFTGFAGGINPSVAYGTEMGEITVNASFQSEGSFDFVKQPMKVSKNLAETYGYLDNVKDGVSALDVLVRVHEVAMGIEGEPSEDDIVAINGMLAVETSGFVTTVMGEPGSSFSFTLNGEQPVNKEVTFPAGSGFPESYLAYTIIETQVNEGANLEFFILQDTSYLDMYTWFEHSGQRVDSLKVMADSNLALNLKGIMITFYGAAKDKTSFINPIEDANLVLLDKNTGGATPFKELATDEDGSVNHSFAKPGEYIISIESPEYELCTMPWLEVTVIDSEANIPADIPEDDAPARVTIATESAPIVAKEPLEIGWFDLRPFISKGAENYIPSNKIVTAHSLVEAVYFNLYKNDPTRVDLDISANSTTAQAIRENLDISNGSYGLSINSVFKDSNIVMSAINDDFKSLKGIGIDQVVEGSDIVFYPYKNGYDFGAFDVLKVTTRTDFGYPVVALKLKVKKDNWDSGIAAVEGAKIHKVNDEYVYGTTGSNGIVNVEFYGGSDKEHSGSFLITAKAEGVVAPYLKVNYDFNGVNVTVTDTSKKVLADTSLSKFTIDAYGTELNAENYVNNNLPFEVKNSVGSITLSAITADEDAIISLTGTAIDNTTGGSISVPLETGENKLSLVVKNGQDSENHTLKVVRLQGESNVFTSVNRVINGITSYSNYSDSTFDANYIIGKIGAGKTITEKEKNAFLTQVVNTAGSSNVGNQAKMAIALTAINIDATKVPVQGSDVTVDLVEKVYNNKDDKIYPTFLPFMLMLEDLGNYQIPSDSKWDRENIIKYILDNYEGYTGWNPGNGIDAAAMMIPALAPYYKNAENPNGLNGISMETCKKIKECVDKVILDFKTMQQSNGSFGNNTNSTAVVISALSSLGIDSNGESFTQKGSGKSALESIFTFETTDGRLGFSSTTYNQLASSDGLQALASYLNYYNGGSKNGDGSVYRFKKEIAPYTKWPNAKLLTAIIVTPPTKTQYKVGEQLDTKGMTVKAVYNSQDATAQVINEGYSVIAPDMDSAGSKTVKVNYLGQESSFVISVKKENVEEEVKTVSLSVKDSGKTIATNSKLTIEKGKTTVLDALQMVLNSAGKSVTIKNGSYVAAIDGKGEFDGGKNSGWLYSVNGTTPPTTPAGEYILNGNETILWYYTLDYTKDPGSSNWQTENAAPSVEGGKASATVTVEAKTDAQGKANANITSTNITDTLNKAIEAAKNENKDGKKEVIPEVVIDIKANSDAKSVLTTMPKSSVNDIMKAGGMLVVNTPTGNVSFDQNALKSLVENAGGSEIALTTQLVEPADNSTMKSINQLTGRPVFNITAMSGNKGITSFGNGKVTLSLPYKLRAGEAAGNIRITYVSEDGKLTTLDKSVYDEKKQQVTGETNHFSYYAITYENTQFADVKTSDWFYNSIMELAKKGIVKGKSENLFEPYGNVTRAEFVQILYNISGKSSNFKDQFTDVKTGDWFSGPVNWAAENNIVKGFDNSFSPNANITRQDMAVILNNYIKIIEKKEIAEINAKISFKDQNSINDYAKDAVEAMQKGGIVNGVKNSDESYNFNPKNNATRGEAATMIYNYLMK